MFFYLTNVISVGKNVILRHELGREERSSLLAIIGKQV